MFRPQIVPAKGNDSFIKVVITAMKRLVMGSFSRLSYFLTSASRREKGTDFSFQYLLDRRGLRVFSQNNKPKIKCCGVQDDQYENLNRTIY